MLMKHLLYLSLPLLLLSCKQSPADGFDIPNEVNPQKTAAHTQAPGTHLFLAQPKGYTLDTHTIRYIKDNDTYFMVLENPRGDFSVALKGMKDTIASIEQRSGVAAYYKKDFKFGQYDAFFCICPADAQASSQIIFTFGNQSYLCMIMASYKKDDDKTRDELKDCFLSVYVDENASMNISAFQTYTMDLTNTDFKYEQQTSQVTVYTTVPDANLQDPSLSSILVMSLPPMDPDQKREYAKQMIPRYEANGIEVDHISNEGITFINNEHSYVIEYEGKYKGKKVSVYQVVTGDENNSILFCASAYENHDEYLKQFRKLARTIQMKK